MPKDGQRKRIIFTHLDKRGKPVAADDSAYECLNCIIGRDAVVRRRPSAKFAPGASQNTTRVWESAIPSLINNYVTTTIDTPEECDINGFVPIECRNTSGGIDYYFSFMTSDGQMLTRSQSARTLNASAYMKGTNMRHLADSTDEQAAYSGSQSFSHASYDSSSVGYSPGAYKETFFTTGGLLQRMRETEEVTLDIAAVSMAGMDPAHLDIVARSAIVLIHRGQAFYVNDEAPNFVFYSLNQTPEGAPQYFTFDETNNFLKIGSGSGDDIRSLISFGDSVYIFTRKSVWRFSGNTGEGSSTRLVRVFDVGCPSRQGIEYISSSVGGAESRDSSGMLAFITASGELVLTDGVSSQTVSDPVAPTLKKLTAGQIESAIVTRMDEPGYLAVLWPSPGNNKTLGLVYDYFLNRWAGELEYGFKISSADYYDIYGVGNTFASINSGIDLRMFYLNNTQRALMRSGGIVLLFAGTDDHDLWWRMKSNNSTASNYYDHYDMVSLGSAFRTKVKAQDLDMGSPGVVKRLTGVIYEMEPIGDWNVDLQLYADSNPNPKAWAFRQAGEDSNQYGTVATEDAVYNTSVGRARKRFVIDSGERVISGIVSVGCEVDAGSDKSVTITQASGGTSATVSIAQPTGFVLHSVELVYNAERDFGAPTYGSGPNG